MARISEFFSGLSPTMKMGLGEGSGAAGGYGLSQLLSSLSGTTQPASYQQGLPTSEIAGQQSGIFSGAPSQFLRSQKFTPEQQQLFGQASQMGLQGLQNPFQGFDPIRNQTMRDWEKNILPALTSQFAGMDAQRSSGFNEALGQSGADLASQLASLQSQYGLQQQGLSQNLFGLGLTPQFEQSFQKRQPSLIEALLSMLLQGGGQAAGKFLGGA
jgi:hypothetical protein